MAISSVPSSTSAVTFVSKGQERPHHDHCPLCIDSMVHPADDNRKPAIIFLGMEHVMIGDRSEQPLHDEIRSTVQSLFPGVKRFTDYQWLVAKGRNLHPDALKNLHDLIQRIELSGRRALVVLSGIWKNDATLQQLREEVFKQHSFCAYLCGKTAPRILDTSWTPECKQGFDFSKGAKESFGLKLKKPSDVIEFWLRDHGFDPDSTNFVIIDYGVERFEKRSVNPPVRFREEDFKQATEVLKV